MDPITQQAALGAAGAGGSGPLYVDDVFSTFLYEGNGSSKTITNGIDLSGEGGFVWIKSREASVSNILSDTEHGGGYYLISDSNNAMGYQSGNMVASYNSDGFNLGNSVGVNDSSKDYVSWTFRKAPGFFDVVKWTGGGSDYISHNLGSVPGCIILKRTDTAESKEWTVYHVGAGTTSGSQNFLKLNSSSAKFPDSGILPSSPTSTQFEVSNDFNASGGTYVAYLFAHDDAQFGTNEDESIIKCGTISGYLGRAELGFEPQFVLLKETNYNNGNWILLDVMRGWHSGSNNDAHLFANLTNSEANYSGPAFDATGFNYGQSGENWIYIAIRRPHKPPEAGTDVFKAFSHTSSGSTKRTTGFPVDFQIVAGRSGGWTGQYWFDRHREFSTNGSAGGKYLRPALTDSESSTNDFPLYHDNTGFKDSSWLNTTPVAYYNFKRAPGFFDMVAYEGTTSTRVQSHNLGVAPELLITKCTTHSNTDWLVGVPDTGKIYYLSASNGYQGTITSYYSSISSTGYTIPTYTNINGAGRKYIAYLFATLAGVSKVGTYTGTGNDLNVDCGFTTGARFILIKRHDSSGDWIVFNHASGIVQNGNDPYLNVNNGSAEQTGENLIEPLNSGFTVKSGAGSALNALANTYIFLAIA